MVPLLSPQRRQRLQGEEEVEGECKTLFLKKVSR